MKTSWSSAVTFLLAAILCETCVASSHHGRQISHIRRHSAGHGLSLIERGHIDNYHKRRSCKKKPVSSSVRASNTAKVIVSGTAKVVASHAQPSQTPSTVQAGGEPGSGPPPNWPTKTQAAATYSATAASPSDPMLLSVSEVGTPQ